MDTNQQSLELQKRIRDVVLHAKKDDFKKIKNLLDMWFKENVHKDHFLNQCIDYCVSMRDFDSAFRLASYMNSGAGSVLLTSFIHQSMLDVGARTCVSQNC